MLCDSIVETSAGRIRGRADAGLMTFRGVPFARADRFEPPQPALGWAGVRDAVERGPIPPQTPSRLAFLMGDLPDQRQAEDCLEVSVWTPGLTGDRPVMVWIHGGAFLSGGGQLPWSDGDKLAREGDVVVVSISYRLGVLGYLWSADAERRNLGLQDQLAAVEWVRTNIDRFGGDPGAITLFGQSAGASSIASMLKLAGPAPTFRRAILQSAPLGAPATEDQAVKYAELFARALKTDPRKASVANLLAAQRAAAAESGAVMPLVPVLAPQARTTAKGSVEALIGWTKDDAAPFVTLRGEAVDLRSGQNQRVLGLTMALFSRPSEAFARNSALIAKPYVYSLDWQPKGSRFGAAHCVDLPLLLGHEDDWRGALLLGDERWSDVEALGRRMRGAWAAFARSGNPTTAADWDWTASGPDTPVILR